MSQLLGRFYIHHANKYQHQPQRNPYIMVSGRGFSILKLKANKWDADIIDLTISIKMNRLVNDINANWAYCARFRLELCHISSILSSKIRKIFNSFSKPRKIISFLPTQRSLHSCNELNHFPKARIPLLASVIL